MYVVVKTEKKKKSNLIQAPSDKTQYIAIYRNI